QRSVQRSHFRLAKSEVSLPDGAAPLAPDALYTAQLSRAGHNREVGMQRVMRAMVMITAVLLVPAVLYAQQAQATIAGVVKDASGAVLPGVSVDAASPVLTEKVRSVITDGTGQY